MGYEKFTWVIKNFSSLQSEYIKSDIFVIGGCKWCLLAYPNGKQNASYLSLYLDGPTLKTLPCGCRRRIRFRLTVVNQLSENLSRRGEGKRWFDKKLPLCGYEEVLLLTKLNAKHGGFLVNNEVKIVAEVDVLEVIGKLDVSKESQEVIKPRKRMRLYGDGGAVSSHLHKETSSVDVNGFQVLPSQAESVKRIFERHPYMALEFRAKNQQLRASCINVLLSLIKTLCQSLQDISIDDLGQTEQVLTFLQNSGFKVDWLERKLEEVKEKKIQEHIGKSRMQGLEEDLKVFKKKCSDIEALLEKEKEELKGLKQKCSDIEALLEKEKGKVLAAAARTPLTFDDIL
ncbi:Meprin and TRAF (MATH) homology domain-containing protein [Arabidopsis thaliana]|uniref:MATH domain and coiled-coil domain-containing protein At3g44800 n=1 Tax=Arabidopsis thaliana TaxID=3702 RepID=MCC14_ARATH|nr:Meprin and TRAF (MATH) homology domain-containing protein [Arabidopsis thaliana]F4J4A1.2 RecName: Full=MATH domain and coiled-coil domain-containing protein At3g44800; AltName: Full=RTM3-like protein At3g44800 [Arabidopsis thaliana]AEE77955.2 Meprin and TRAF (MATH) homology domain-containing protein [Arabidopsis thaliana]|eukprot:NP_190066.3 Meprin and TRAF (MATH) homology domain-containing protein [Arabidopsis thaliana]